MFLRSRWVATALILASGHLTAAEEVTPEARVAQVEKDVAAMNGTLKRLSKETARAKNDGNVQEVNCLTLKLNLVKGLLKASEQAKVILIESSDNKDTKTAAAYGSKIKSYGQSVAEVEQSIGECSGKGKHEEEGVTLVYIRPEEQGEPNLNEYDSPLIIGEETPNDGFPVVPPASPFR